MPYFFVTITINHLLTYTKSHQSEVVASGITNSPEGGKFKYILKNKVVYFMPAINAFADGTMLMRHDN